MIKHLNILLTLCLLNVNILFAQDSSVKNAIGTFQEYAENYPVEKIYLHLDKPYYAAGEYMYIRAYLTDMHLSQENAESRIIYVELSNNQKNLIKRILLYSEENEYAGQIQLPDSLTPTAYHLRAYTNWMRNSGEEYFYHRDIYIGNISEQPQESSSQKFDYQVSFFPEGGNLLAGFSNKIAFKALGNDGFGTEISGALSDSEGNELLQFQSRHSGMGSFSFVPEKGKTYQTIVQSNGITKEYTLPPSAEGIILSARQDEQTIDLTIRSTAVQPEAVFLIGQSRQTVCYASEGIMEGNEHVYKIDKDKFPTGIARFTLFKDGRPASERLVFIDRKDDLQIEIIPDKEEYGNREKAAVKIQVTDALGQPVEGSFSLSVTDDKTVLPSIGEQNIKGCLLLDSDLKGYIESPGWYFAGNEPERSEDLDNLLCTQGWTRFVWDQLSDSPVFTYPAEDEFKITGKVTNVLGRPVKEASVIFSGKESLLGSATTDNDGRFGFYGFDSPEGTEFVLQCRTKRDGKTMIGFEFDKPDNRYIQTNVLPFSRRKDNRNTSQPEAYAKQAVQQIMIEEGRRIINLPEVKVEAKGIPERQQFGLSSFRISGKRLDKPIQIGALLQSVTPSKRGLNSINGWPGAIYIVDGKEIKGDDFIYYYSYLPAYAFESIEIYREVDSFARYGFRAPGGAIVIETKKNRGDGTLPDASFKIYHPEGYCVQKEFYIPDYDKPEVKKDPTPDLRTTVYWNPAIRTDPAGIAEVGFFTADNAGSCSYILEGIGAGKIGFIKR